MNRFKTLILLATLTALLLWAGQALGGRNGLAIAMFFALVMNFASYWFSDKIVLRMYRAQEIAPGAHPWLFGAVRELALRANLPMPRVYIVPEDAPNAFATGRDPSHAAVAVTEGLLRLLPREEVEAVLAHELGHIKNRDTLVMTVAATLAGALSMLANMAMWSSMLGGRSQDDEEGGHPLAGLLGVLIAPIAATLIQMAISRSREFIADADAARISGNPAALASALRRIETWSARIPMQAATPATAHLMIANPFSAHGLTKLFSTHPPTAERVERLEAMALRGYAILG